MLVKLAKIKLKNDKVEPRKIVQDGRAGIRTGDPRNRSLVL